MAVSLLTQMIDPEVMGKMISAKLPHRLTVLPFAKVDTTLAGQPGSTITVPAWGYIGDAADVAENAPIDASLMSTTSKPYTVKKIAKAVALTDEAVLSGLGNPVGEAGGQITKAMASKMDADAIAALLTAPTGYAGSAAPIAYTGVVAAIDLFDEETETDKVMFINPKQMTQLRLDANFISADKYKEGVALTGEVGMIAGVRIVRSRRVVKTGDTYKCPIIQLNGDIETDDEAPAITVYMKRDVLVEDARVAGVRTEITATEHYVAALTNESKVVVATFKATPVG